MPIRVLLVDDQPILADGIRTILAARASEFTVVGQISHAKEVVETAQKLTPDVILMDIDMPHKNGLELLRELRAFTTSAWKPCVVMLSYYADKHHIADAINSKAQGYLVKMSVGEKEVLEAVRTVAAGKTYFCPTSRAVRHALLDEPTHQNKTLTQAQMSIAKLVAVGRSSKEIAEELNLALSTVENHRTNIYRKLNLRNAAELTAYAKEQGW
jgi:two-component system NarL family response regulator